MANPKTKKVKTTDEVDFASLFSHYTDPIVIPDTSAVVQGFENAEVLEYEKPPPIFCRTKKEFVAICPLCYDSDGKTVELAKPDMKEKRQHYTCEMKDKEDKYRHPRIHITAKFLSNFYAHFCPKRLAEESLSEYTKRASAYTTGLQHVNWYCKKCMSILLDFSPRLNSQGTESAWKGHFHYRCMCKKDQPKLIGIIHPGNVFKNKLIPPEVQDFARQFVDYPLKYKEDEPASEMQISSSYKPKLKRTAADLNTEAEQSDHEYDELVIDENHGK